MGKRKILITGGAGFVGSNLAIGLKKRYSGTRIIAFDNLKRHGSELNVERLLANGVKFLHGDIRSNEDLSAVGSVDVIVECAAEPSTIAGYDGSPNYVIDTNLGGTVNCLECARKRGADFIFISTNRIYPFDKVNKIRFKEEKTRFTLSAGQRLPGVSRRGISEGFPVDGARSFYGASKLASELLLEEYIYGYKMRGVINRCAVIAGPWQMGTVEQGSIALWVISHFFKKRLNYIGFGGGGKQIRDVLHIDDLVDLIDKQLRNINKINGEVYNVGGGVKNTISLLELTDICQRITGNKIKIGRVRNNRKADIRMYITDYSKVKDALDWKPTRTIHNVVEDIHDWLFDNRECLARIFI